MGSIRWYTYMLSKQASEINQHTESGVVDFYIRSKPVKTGRHQPQQFVCKLCDQEILGREISTNLRIGHLTEAHQLPKILSDEVDVCISLAVTLFNRIQQEEVKSS
jgi:hypothetical protein